MFCSNINASITCHCDCLIVMFSLQLLLERKSKEVGKLIEETEKSIKDLAENINQAKVNSQSKPFYYVKMIKEQFSQ